MIKIQKNDFYSLSDASLYLKKSEHYVKIFIAKKMLKANSLGEGNGKRYFIKGEYLIKFLARWEAGDFHN